MIFVTVGTHEQPFNRLIQKVDELKRDGVIKDDVIIQTGFSTYKPKYCQWSKLISYQQMVKNVADARIVITHGGPASFIMPLQIGKTPIVVPRQHQFNEHHIKYLYYFFARRDVLQKRISYGGMNPNDIIYLIKPDFQNGVEGLLSLLYKQIQEYCKGEFLE